MPEPDEVTMDTEDIPSSTLSIGFIGAGVMASALVDGLVQKSVVDSPSRISCSDPWPKALDVARSKGINVCKSNEAVCEQASDVIILAVKPDVIPLVCADIMKVRSDALVISIAAGITISQLENDLPGRRIVRVMPNTPSLVGEAACGYAIGRGVTDLDKTIVETIFGAVGIALQVEEKLMAAITGLSGSGPAYVYLLIEALSDGGVCAGLPRNVATACCSNSQGCSRNGVKNWSTHGSTQGWCHLCRWDNNCRCGSS